MTPKQPSVVIAEDFVLIPETSDVRFHVTVRLSPLLKTARPH
jgi:hypothetical protein